MKLPLQWVKRWWAYFKRRALVQEPQFTRLLAICLAFFSQRKSLHIKDSFHCFEINAQYLITFNFSQCSTTIKMTQKRAHLIKLYSISRCIFSNSRSNAEFLKPVVYKSPQNQLQDCINEKKYLVSKMFSKRSRIATNLPKFAAEVFKDLTQFSKKKTIKGIEIF